MQRGSQLTGQVSSETLGTWVAAQKRRDVSEGLVLRALFGPFGVLIEALLPVGNAGTPTRRGVQSIDDQGVIASIAERFRSALDDADPAWQALPYRWQRAILKPVERTIGPDFKLDRTRAASYTAEARRIVLATGRG